MLFKKKRNKAPLITNINGKTEAVYDYEAITEFYPPGKYINNEYVSDFFEISFSGDDNWEFVSDDWLQKYSKEAQAKQTDLLLGSLDDIGGDSEAMRDWVESLYLEVEMLACYNENEKTSGDVKFTIRDSWPDNNMTSEEFAEKTAETLRIIGENIVCGKEQLCGKVYSTVMGVVRGKDTSMTLKFYYYKKDSMLCEILCRAFVGREYVFDEFEKHLKSFSDN